MKKFCKKYAVMSFTTFVILCKKYWYLGNKVTAKLLFPKKIIQVLLISNFTYIRDMPDCDHSKQNRLSRGELENLLALVVIP